MTPPRESAEHVLAIERAAWFGGRWPQGFTSVDAPGPLLDALAQRAQFLPRDRAEQDPRWKQLIPYCAVTAGAEILMVRRRTQGTEQRLHGRMSIGLGGHVGPEDGDIGDPKLLRRGLLRELREELALPPGPLEPRFVGWINDDSNPVGEVHVGLAFHLELPTDPGRAGAELVKIREISKLEGGLVPLVGRDSPWQNLCHLETWSRILIEAWFAPPCRTAEPPTSHESEQGTRTD